MRLYYSSRSRILKIGPSTPGVGYQAIIFGQFFPNEAHFPNAPPPRIYQCYIEVLLQKSSRTYSDKDFQAIKIWIYAEAMN